VHPDAMKRVLCVAIEENPARGLTLVDEADPACPEEGAVVAMRARPINPADLLILTGRHLFRPELPAFVGIEGAGVVLEAGPRSRLRRGQAVAIPWGGTWVEKMAVHDDQALPLPDGVDLEQAAMFSVNPFTAIGLLEGVPPGATIAVNAATSAVSRLVLALARRRGVAVVAIARDERARDELLSLGAKAVLVDGPDLTARLLEAASGPVARALDAVAGDASERLFDAVAEGGTLIVYGLLSSDRVHLPAAGLVFRDVHVTGFSRLRSIRSLPRERRDELTRELVALLSEGAIASAIEARYPLDRVKEAIEHHLRRDRKGKILLVSEG
jgi:mitochondrial enoyl-[acyl-carrier protein] reductase / trans-2-enoyl-CoA reductase